MTNIKIIISTILCLTVMIDCYSQTTDEKERLSSEAQRSIIENFSRELKINYIFPDSAKLIVTKLDSAYNAGFFNNSTYKTNFAEHFNDLIKSISNDNHLGVKYKPNYQLNEQPRLAPHVRPKETIIGRNNKNSDGEIQEPVEFKIIDGNIGYLRLDIFEEQPIFFDKIDEAFKNVATTKALIIDLRSCRGGSPKAENYVVSYLLSPATQLSSIFRRINGEINEEKFYTLQSVNEKKYTEKPIYILTGNKTFSAAENFCYDLQALKRATIVGVNTLGGANPGKEFSIGNSFFTFIPTGRSYSYITKTNWEGIGIKPDVLTLEKDALTKAIELINAN